MRLESLGSAVANLVTIANLLVAAGVANISKIKSKDKPIIYRQQDGCDIERLTVHLRYDMTRCLNIPKQSD